MIVFMYGIRYRLQIYLPGLGPYYLWDQYYTVVACDMTHESVKMNEKYCFSQPDICVTCTTNKYVNTFITIL